MERAAQGQGFDVHDAPLDAVRHARRAGSGQGRGAGTARPTAAAIGAAILGLLAACSSVAPPESAPTGPAPPRVARADDTRPPPVTSTALVRPRSRWVRVDWTDLPGWQADRSAELWPAFLRGCDKAAAEWGFVCTLAKRAVTPAFSDEAARAFLEEHLEPYRVEAPDGNPEGLVTGYFEPLIEASRIARGPYRVPLYAPPADLGQRRPYWTRQQIETLPSVAAGLSGRAIAYVVDPLDALILQIQGSGRLTLAEADGSRRTVRLAFGGHNDQPYKSVGRWLIEQGELRAEQASWPAIKAWAREHPSRVNEMLWANPRYVFFREEPLIDPSLGPKGAQAVALTPGRSIAVDPLSIPYGTPVWIDSTEPLAGTPLRRAVMAQDTGSAITGAVRADFFWGSGTEAEAQAGRMKQPLRLWALWPKSPG